MLIVSDLCLVGCARMAGHNLLMKMIFWFWRERRSHGVVCFCPGSPLTFLVCCVFSLLSLPLLLLVTDRSTTILSEQHDKKLLSHMQIIPTVTLSHASQFRYIIFIQSSFSLMDIMRRCIMGWAVHVCVVFQLRREGTSKISAFAAA